MYDSCWKRYIEEYGNCLATKWSMGVRIDGSVQYLDYRIGWIESLATPETKNIMLITGIGSGWEWISELGFHLACHGHKIYLLSWPGTGSSSDPLITYYRGISSFFNEASVAHQFYQELLRRQQIRGRLVLVGHSMGAEIAMRLLLDYPDIVEMVIMLSPTGVRKINGRISGTLRKAFYATRFMLCGGIHRLEWKLMKLFGGGRTPIDQLVKCFSPPRSSMDKQRRPQRLSEFRRICEGTLPTVIRQIIARGIDVQMLAIWGWQDFVNPPWQMRDLLEASSGWLVVSVIPRQWHNNTLGPRSDLTAETIDKFIRQ